MRRACLLLFFLLLCAAPAHATGLHRCVDAHGNPVFSDQPCAAIGSIVQPQASSPQAPEAPSAGRLRARTCAHTADALVRGLKIAIAADDVNQLAAFYHWPGIGNAEAEAILERLGHIAGVPIVSAELVRAPTDSPLSVNAAQPTSAAVSDAVAIELVQSRAAGDTTTASVHTSFALVQYAGCWWVRF